MGKKGASKKTKGLNKDKSLLGIKKAIVRKGETGGSLKKLASARTLPDSSALAEQVAEDAKRFESIQGLSLGKLKKRHVMETRKLRQAVQEMTRGKLKLKKRNLDQKRNRKEIGKEIQRLEREHEERQAAEIAHITQRNQAQKARDAAAATMQDEISDAGEGTHGGNQAAPQFSFGDMQPEDNDDMLGSDDEDL